MKISIAIPTYESHGNGWLYLSELLNSIVKQTEKEIEVVVSDQSTDNNVKNLCEYYNNFLNLKYVNSKNTERSNSVNANIAIKNCSSDLIKIMFGFWITLITGLIASVRCILFRFMSWLPKITIVGIVNPLKKSTSI